MKLFLSILLVFLISQEISCRSPTAPEYCRSRDLFKINPSNGDVQPLQKIPGTSLYAGIYYKISMKKYPRGVITYTQSEISGGGGNYVQIDNNPSNLPHYEKGGKWDNDAQWMLEPVEALQRSGKNVYMLRNKARPTSAMSNKPGTIDGANHRFVILENDVGTSRPRPDALLTVVTGDDREKEFKYQIKFDFYPEGSVTWTEKEYGERGSHYIQISEADKGKYQKGREWWDDTLFSFTPQIDQSSRVMEPCTLG